MRSTPKRTKGTNTHETRGVSQDKVVHDDELNTFTPMQTGQPDQDLLPDRANPAAAQGGRGPLNQEGEGDRQNDQLAELEEIEPGDEIK